MIYCFDLDNTLCKTNSNKYEDSIPMPERIKKVNDLYDKGHTIIIETARGSVSGKSWFYFTLNQLKTWGLKFHNIRTNVKFYADFYIDDKAVNDKEFFNGIN